MNTRHIEYRPGVLRLLDQTQLPLAEVFVELQSWQQVADAIATLRVRGAPAIGIVAAYAIALEAHQLSGKSMSDVQFASALGDAASGLVASRPTAVNLTWAVQRMLSHARSQLDAKVSRAQIAASLDTLARVVHDEDITACRSIGRYGATLFNQRTSVLTHCNTGDLATGGYGTALGIVRSLWSSGMLERVYVDETRPVLQGARLTTWELQRDGIPYTLIADGMAAYFMQRKDVQAVVVGADRIARNGDTANKIGTYGLAVLARAHDIPFIVAAPRSTFDTMMADGSKIIIEQRRPEEITAFAGARSAPRDATVANPAFDVTPAALITSIVTEEGVLSPPFEESIAKLPSTLAAQVAR